MKNIRAFLAVNLPVALIEEVRELQDQLRERASQAGMKVVWVPPTNMHVTLKFLGEIPEESAWSIRDALAPVAAAQPIVSVTVRGTGVFPDVDRPRVMWVGVDSEGDALALLARRLDETLEGLGFALESRPFHAHLTLGRVKQGASPELLAGVEQVSFVHSDCSVHEVVLYQSVLERKGAEYTALGRFPLAGQSPARGRPVITEEEDHGR